MGNLIKVPSAVVHGITGRVFDIEVSAEPGSSGLSIVGVPESHAREIRVRVLSALRSLGHRLTGVGVTVRIPAQDDH